ncbi:MAG: hypothetical protein ACRDTA_13280 [Pseudonocardiaceae bacterium]
MSKKRGQRSQSGAAPVQPEPQEPTLSTGHPTAWDAFSNWSMNARWRRVTFKLVVVILILGMVGAAVPSIGSAIEYSILKIRLPGAFEGTLPSELTSKSGVRVVERVTTLDLSGWKWTSSRDPHGGSKISRGLSLTSFVLRKTEPGAKYFVHTASSDSKVEPSIWVDSHPFRIVQAKTQSSSNTRQWNVFVDISQEPDDRPFTVNFIVTFWNGFQKKEDWWSGFRVVHATEKSIYRVIFPPELPATNVKFRHKDIAAGETVDLDTTMLKVTPAPSEMPVQTLSWTVDNPAPDRSYRVAWTWPESAAPTN